MDSNEKATVTTTNEKGPWFTQFGNRARTLGIFGTKRTLEFAVMSIAHALNNNLISNETRDQVTIHLQHLEELLHSLNESSQQFYPEEINDTEPNRIPRITHRG